MPVLHLLRRMGNSCKLLSVGVAIQTLTHCAYLWATLLLSPSVLLYRQSNSEDTAQLKAGCCTFANNCSLMEDSLLLLALMSSSFPCVEERGREEWGRWKEAGEERDGLSPPTEELMEVENKP